MHVTSLNTRKTAHCWDLVVSFRCPLLAQSRHANALTNVRYWGQSGHDANGPLCRLMTQNGHIAGTTAVVLRAPGVETPLKGAL